MLRIIIAGSREFNDYEYLKKTCLETIKELKNNGYNTKRENIEIISGTASGADILGEKFAKEHNLKVVRFPADWSMGKRAGYIRNSEMSKYSIKDNSQGVLIAYWLNNSKGTKHMIDLANKDNLKVFIFDGKDKPKEDSLNIEQITELINRRRRQILVLSCVYYQFDDNLVSDSEYDKRVHELIDLQNKYPDIANQCIYAEEFKGMSSGSGFNLPYKDSWVMDKARELLRNKETNKRYSC